MSDLSFNVTWQEILNETLSENNTHCRAIVAPLNFHQEILEEIARIILGSYRPSHPDLIVIGTVDKPPAIGNKDTMTEAEYKNTARYLIEEIALRPLESKRRLGVIMSADKILKPAANSLLKLAEEPPDYAYLLFLMEDGKLFLPTLKSRSRFSVLVIEERKESFSIPQSDSQWLEWYSEARKADDVDAIIKNLEAWANFAAGNSEFLFAQKIYKLRIIASQKNLSVLQLCDLIILILKGDNQLEYILDDFWQA